LGKSDPVTVAKVGDYFVLSRQVKEAIPFYQQALSFHSGSDDPALTNLRGETRPRIPRHGAAGRGDQDARSCRSGEPHALRDVRVAWRDSTRAKGDVEKAMHNFEQTLLIDSSRPDNYLRLAETFLRLKRPDKAVETMRSARAKFPGSTHRLQSLL
jgi:tetratricopeptide (TPR) repeat protein